MCSKSKESVWTILWELDSFLDRLSVGHYGSGGMSKPIRQEPSLEYSTDLDNLEQEEIPVCILSNILSFPVWTQRPRKGNEFEPLL